MRAILESHAARDGHAPSPGVPTCAHLDDLLDQMREAAEAGDSYARPPPTPRSTPTSCDRAGQRHPRARLAHAGAVPAHVHHHRLARAWIVAPSPTGMSPSSMPCAAGDARRVRRAFEFHFEAAARSLARVWSARPGRADRDRPRAIRVGAGRPHASRPLSTREREHGPRAASQRGVCPPGAARLRVDVLGGPPREHVLDDMDFLELPAGRRPHRVRRDAARRRTSSGMSRPARTSPTTAAPCASRATGRRGRIQKVIVTMLALRMEALGLHPSHSSAVRYRDRTILFLGGESNHGKSMGQIEACRRAAASQHRDHRHRRGRLRGDGLRGRVPARSAPRAPSALTRPPRKGVEQVLGGHADLGAVPEGRARIDVVIVPAIDGNFDPDEQQLHPFEAQFQAFHSLQNYFLTNELLAPASPCRWSTPTRSGARAPSSRTLRRASLLLRPCSHPAGAHGRGRTRSL